MRTKSIALAALAMLCAGRGLAATPSAVKQSPAIGTQVADFNLRDFHGQPHSLSQDAKGKIAVLVVMGVECPLCKIYTPRVAELAKEYAAKGVVFLGLDANRQDAVTEIAAFARTHDVSFPILKDLNQTVVDQLGATRTPEVVVLDADRKIRYRGRIDDQYGFKSNSNFTKTKPEQRDLVNALDQLLAGQQVAASEVPAQGCLIGRDRKTSDDTSVTYTKQISRILNANCVFCHRENQIAPFALTSYDEVSGWAGMIDEVVQAQRMPPWHADERYGHFKNDARLSAEDKATIARWVANGAPQGDPKDLPEPPKFADGWMIPTPDQVVKMSNKPFKIPATGVVEYQMFVVDPGWKEDKWISAIEPRPSNASVVHHILMFVLPPDGKLAGGVGNGNDFLGAFAPGLRPEPLPTGMARLVPAGSKLIFQMHYTPNGTEQEDLSYCGFVFADPQTVSKEVRVNSAVNFVFQIPPGDDNFAVQSRHVFKDDTMLLTLMPHMHLRGKAFRYEVTYPDGKQEVLLDVPRYDFGWQTNYRFAEPKLLPKGTRLDCVAHFDNSADNLNNPNPKVPVRFGDQTFEEMMIGFFEATPVSEDRLHPEKAPRKLSRMEQFDLIMAATKGEPDDNVRVGAYMATLEPSIFRMFTQIMQSMAPQVDRLCVTAIKDGKISEIMGPLSSPSRHGPGQGKDDKGKSAKGKDGKGSSTDESNDAKNAELEAAIEKMENGRSPVLAVLPTVDAEGETLAQIAQGTDVVVFNDISKAKGKLFETMAAAGVKSSMHVPCKMRGKQATINFWSTEPDGFPPAAQTLMERVAKIMAAPKGFGLPTAVK